MRSYEYYQWKTWLLMAIAFVFSLFHRGALSVISPTLVDELHLNATAMSNIASITYYTYALMQIPAGIALDTFGYRKVSGIGIATTGIGSALIGLANGTMMLLAARLLIGLGTSVLFISALKAQRIWFSHRDFIKISGYLSFIGALGAISSTYPLALLASMFGWRMTMITIGMLCLLIGVLIFTQLKDSPSDLGFAVHEPVRRKPKGSFGKMLMRSLLHPVTIRNFLILFTTIGTITAFTGLWGIPFLMNQYLMNPTEAAFFLAFVMYGSLAGSLLINQIARSFENRLNVLLRYALMAQFTLWFVFLYVYDGKPPLFVLVLFLFLIGFAATAHLLSFVDVHEQLLTDDSGLASSIVNAGEFAGSTLLSLGIGLLLDLTFVGVTINGVRMYEVDQYLLAFRLFALFSLLGILVTFMKNKTVKNQI